VDKKILVVNGHPDPRPERYGYALCDAYGAGVQSSGLETRRLNVGELHFPFDTAIHPTAQPLGDLARAVEAIHWATQLAIVFPLWLDAPPPILCKLFEASARTKGMPCAAHIVVTMSMPAFMHRSKFRADGHTPNSICAISLAGVAARQTTFIGSVEKISAEQRRQWLETIAAYGALAAKRPDSGAYGRWRANDLLPDARTAA